MAHPGWKPVEKHLAPQALWVPTHMHKSVDAHQNSPLSGMQAIQLAKNVLHGRYWDSASAQDFLGMPEVNIRQCVQASTIMRDFSSCMLSKRFLSNCHCAIPYILCVTLYHLALLSIRQIVGIVQYNTCRSTNKNIVRSEKYFSLVE